MRKDVTELIERHTDVLSWFFDHAADMVFLMEVAGFRQFRYVFINREAMKVARISESAYGKRIDEVYADDPKKAELLISKYQEAVEVGKPVSFVSIDEICGESVLTPIINSDGVCTHVLSLTRDVTERKRLEEKLQFMAYHDTLTGLPNRRLFEERLSQVMTQTVKTGLPLAILYLDCDLFKEINDSMGHEIGDQFLQEFANRLQCCVRSSDTIARMGGDEFMILLPAVANQGEAIVLTQRILDSVRRPWKIRQHTFTASVSIGVALYPEHGSTGELLMRHADIALYQAKSQGRNQYTLFCPSTIHAGGRTGGHLLLNGSE
ncbi:diguanylate cyclase [Brevibacillus humidisoli]|uniref:sensor domain-containing diguanylate cyclase n=1 Tax=Brevibacillus humidisoli TaxID=2895522 RepID=UPI001E4F6F6A|nr:sensor domain-containing diguanylate cyclase [Brevibacillus humidisoli]UFJ42699.1 diguanylate cyclase [Brevibacillus humidisoli]